VEEIKKIEIVIEKQPTPEVKEIEKLKEEIGKKSLSDSLNLSPKVDDKLKKEKDSFLDLPEDSFLLSEKNKDKKSKIELDSFLDYESVKNDKKPTANNKKDDSFDLGSSKKSDSLNLGGGDDDSFLGGKSEKKVKNLEK
jgi:hypothetical protein